MCRQQLYYRGVDKCSDFIDYCLSFYSNEAVAKPYCIDFSLRMIINSAKKDTANAITETNVPMFPLVALGNVICILTNFIGISKNVSIDVLTN